MSDVRAVVFDFGGVLITSITSQIGEVAASHDVPMLTMLEVIVGPHESGDHPWHRAERGEIALADVQALLPPWAERHGIRLVGDEMATVLRPGGFTVVQEMNDKVAALKRAGFKTGLLTNTFAEFRPTMEAALRFADFTAVVESFAVGSRKPDQAIYEATRDALDVRHDQILYLDDFIQNIETARSLGWSTIHVTDPLAAVAAIGPLLGR
jgi:putative hydrolase of the HAD superfamily